MLCTAARLTHLLSRLSCNIFVLEKHLQYNTIIQYNTPVLSEGGDGAWSLALVELTLDELASCDDDAHIVERSSSRAARGSEQLPRALPDAVAAPVLAIEQDAGQPAQGEAPVATTSSRTAAGVSALSESDPRRATR